MRSSADTGRVVYLTTVGNHESDWPGTASTPGYGDASGGECGVCTVKLLPMPAPATVDQPWWSYDIGLMHFIGMSTEHNFTINSPQYLWLQNDLERVNRSITPWIIFSGHRSMYVDSYFCCELPNGNGGTDAQCAAAGLECSSGYDIQVMYALQANIEPLLYKHQVNLAWAGHYHNVQRQAAVYQNQVIQNAVKDIDSEGNTVFYHDNPQATVWMVIGTAGNGPDDATRNYTWSEKYWNKLFGYAILTAVNATHLDWKFINSANDAVVDRMILTQNFTSWPDHTDVIAPTTTTHSKSGWNSLSSSAQAGIISAIVIVIILVMSVFIFRRLQKKTSLLQNTAMKTSNSREHATLILSPLQALPPSTSSSNTGAATSIKNDSEVIEIEMGSKV